MVHPRCFHRGLNVGARKFIQRDNLPAGHIGKLSTSMRIGDFNKPVIGWITAFGIPIDEDHLGVRIGTEDVLD